MNIGIDIDDTLTNSSEIFVKYARIYNKKHNITYKIDTSSLDQRKAFGWSIDNKKEFASQYLKQILKETTPNDDVVEVIKIIKKLGCNIFLITARKDSEISGMYDFTKQWLIDNNIEFDKLIINSDDKLKVCINNNIKLFIDDDYFTCKKIFDYNKIMVLLYETSYNKMFNCLNMVKVQNWNQILEIIINVLKEEKYEKGIGIRRC